MDSAAKLAENPSETKPARCPEISLILKQLESLQRTYGDLRKRVDELDIKRWQE